MKIPLYQVDAFASRAFEGNPAAVCPLETWLPDGLMQAIAAENNLSETAFFVPADDGFAIRWFTPEAEVELCGHATLASAFVVFNELGFDGDTVVFESRSGPLPVTRDADRLTLDLGYKAIASDPPAGKRLTLLDLPDAEQILQNEEHLVVQTDRAGDFQPGDELLAVPTHICPTSALHKQVYVVSGGRLTGRWDVAARDRWLKV